MHVCRMSILINTGYDWLQPWFGSTESATTGNPCSSEQRRRVGDLRPSHSNNHWHNDASCCHQGQHNWNPDALAPAAAKHEHEHELQRSEPHLNARPIVQGRSAPSAWASWIFIGA